MKTESTRRVPTIHQPWALGDSGMLGILDANNNNNNSNDNPTTMICSYNNNNSSNKILVGATTSINNNSNSNNNNNGNKSRANGGMTRLPCIGERRPSVTSTAMRKPRASSLSDASPDMSTSQRRGSLSSEGPVLPSQRRASVPQGTAPIQPSPNRRRSKLTFLGAGRRVSMLVKYKKAFQGRTKDALPEDQEEENPMEAIREMPQCPRFTTFMSAEAQYAMMKGYEDKLYERIADTIPEVRTSLQRTKTPYKKKISIVDQEKRAEEQEEEEGSREIPEIKSTSSSSSLSTLPATKRKLSVSTSITDVTDPLDNQSTTSTTSSSPGPVTISVPYLKPLRRQSLAVTTTRDLNGNGGMMLPTSSVESSMENLHLQRSHSLPTLDPPGGVSLSKRLVLTYRLESAMDLLDSMKQKESGENSLSPRVVRGQTRQGDVVRDFNSWTQVWNKEFKEIHSK